MDRLSIEILNSTFLFLHQRDKVECMLVCRRWASLINRYSLFHTIRIDNMMQLEYLFKRLRKDPEQQKNVRRLLLDFYLENQFDLNTITAFFPNLRFLESTDTDRLPTGDPQGISNIEHIVETNSSTWTLHLLGSSLCSYLKTVDFSASNISGEKLIAIVRNAPSLTDLTMNSCRISFETLEQLHSNLPLLKTLRLKELKELSGPLPLNITHGCVLTSFEVDFYFVNEVNAMSMVLQYIKFKYTKLEKLKFFEAHSKYTTNGTEVWYDLGLYPFIRKRGFQLKELCVNSDTLPEDVFSIM